MRHRLTACAAGVALMLAGRALPRAQSAGASGPKLLDKETFMEMESVGSPSISPDGKRIVFSRSWADQVKDQQRSNLWMVEADGSRVRELTRGDWRDSAPSWSPDGTRVAFTSDRDGTSQLHVMYVDTGEVAQLTHLTRSLQGVTWSPDGKQIALRRCCLTRIPSSRSSCRNVPAAPNGPSPPSSSIA